ncbi:Uncharacterised protein [Vibrio cholerae]|nr:Uncharacterised protein [Vibrio cholerae]
MTFTPPSIPRTTDNVAKPVTTQITAICSPMPDSKPNTWWIPEAACCAPRPRDVARPNSVANTARISTTCPAQPQARSPSNG